MKCDHSHTTGRGLHPNGKGAVGECDACGQLVFHPFATPQRDAPRFGPVDYMIAFVAGAVVTLLLSTCFGCSVQPAGLAPAPSEATSAALSVALATYGPPARAEAPSVQWVTGDPECRGVAFMFGGRCVRGMQHGAALTVATWEGAAPSQTSLAHEALHWYLWTQGAASADHPGDFYERVERANAELWRSGR